MKRAIIAAIFLLAGCATKPEPEIITKTVNVEVPIPCKTDLGARPGLMTKEQVNAALAQAPNFDERVRLVTDQLLLYIGWTPQVEAAVAGCAKVPGAKGGN